MLLMKAWMETRWRLLALVSYLLISIAINYRSGAGSGLLGALWLILTLFAIALAGCGVKSQAPTGLSEGLAASMQFTLSLPVTRLRLLTVRAAMGLVEISAVTVALGGLIWGLFPSLRETTTPNDFARLVLTTIVFLTAPYCAHVFFAAWLDEPVSLLCAAFALALLLTLGHQIAPAVDIISAFGPASPLLTHKLPWSQMTTSAGIAFILSWAAVQVVQRREY